jgi:hypothetical protein
MLFSKLFNTTRNSGRYAPLISSVNVRLKRINIFVCHLNEGWCTWKGYKWHPYQYLSFQTHPFYDQFCCSWFCIFIWPRDNNVIPSHPQCSAGPHNPKVCLAYPEVRKCASLYQNYQNLRCFAQMCLHNGVFQECLADNLQDATDCGGLVL